MGRVLTLDDVKVDGMTVLLRVDINCPLDPATGAFLDISRIKGIIPTITRLAKAKTVILCHQSRPGKTDFTTTHGHSRELGRLLGRVVKYVEDIHGQAALAAIEKLADGEILMLNNVRMDKEELSRKDDSFEQLIDSQMVTRLAGVADLFVNDAFACAHRNSPSITGFTHVLPCVAGQLMRKEVESLQNTSTNPQRPSIAVLGGIKIDDSIAVADNMLRKGSIDAVWATGGVANLFLEIAGYSPGPISMDFLANELQGQWQSTVKIARQLYADFTDVIHLPVDVAANVEGNRVDLGIDELPVAAPILDLGVQSTINLSQAIRSAGTIILNGPAGVFEDQNFAFGTVEMLSACAETEAFVILGGGHTATLIAKRGLTKKMGHVSTGGGACLDFLAGKTLPAIASLELSAQEFGVAILDDITTED
ncbi:MAG: phosphoglycerate kinase [Candidatus Poseidoniaceae archaeon]|jgi:phosphoglycerate kinase|nr:phosphoglycerate kinase [Candidatus Poseidoniaceae archaeon]